MDVKSRLTTLCYIEKDGKYLMLHRVSKKEDINQGKWIGVGGHFETGLTLTGFRFRGIVTFESKESGTEYMCLYTADGFEGALTACNEGELCWIDKKAVPQLNLWEGDRIFLELLNEQEPFFSLKLCYDRDGKLRKAALNGKELEL